MKPTVKYQVQFSSEYSQTEIISQTLADIAVALGSRFPSTGGGLKPTEHPYEFTYGGHKLRVSAQLSGPVYRDGSKVYRPLEAGELGELNALL